MYLVNELYAKMINDGFLPSEVADIDFTTSYLVNRVGLESCNAIAKELVKMANDDRKEVKYISILKTFVVEKNRVGNMVQSALVDLIVDDVEELMEEFESNLDGSSCKNCTLTVPMTSETSEKLFATIKLKNTDTLIVGNCEQQQFLFHYNKADIVIGITSLTTFKLLNGGGCFSL